MNERRSGVSRRAAIAGIGAGASALVFADRVAAGAAPVPASSGPASSLAALPILDPAVRAASTGNELIGRAYRRIAAIDFRPLVPAASTATWTVSGSVSVASAETLVASFSPRSGDDLFGLTLHIATGGTSPVLRARRELPDGTSVVLGQLNIAPAAGTSNVQLSFPVGTLAAPIEGEAYTVSVDLAPGATLFGATVTAFSPASEFVLVEPFRVWDSRTPSGTQLFPASAGGRISSGQTSGFTVDGSITRAAAALLLNVTVVDTVAAGYLTFYAPNPDGDGTPPGVSSINWYTSNQIVANLVVTGMAGEADVAIACGGGGNTHYVIDCLGYFI